MPKSKNNLLAIDPGTKYLGYASFEGEELTDYGVRAIHQNDGPKGILQHADRILTRLIEEKRPSEIVVERNAFSQIRQNARLTLAVTLLHGLAKKQGVRVFEVDPRTVRKIVCKDGNVGKAELARTVAIRYPELKVYLESDRKWKVQYFRNALDAVAVGIAFNKMSRTFSDRKPAS